MNIGIYDLEHFESVYPLIRFHEKKANRLILFVSEQVFNELHEKFENSISEIEWHVKSEKKSIRSFIWEIYSHAKAKNIESFYLHTVSNNHFFIALLILLLRKNCKAYITVHDVNNFFISRFSFNFRFLIHHISKKILIRVCNRYITISEQNAAYLSQITYGKFSVRWFPGGIFEEKYYSLPPVLSNNLNIIIPGSLDTRRRDYNQVFDFLKKANECRLPVHICLLGGINSEDSLRIIENCKELLKSGIKITCYNDSFVPSNEFDKKMKDAHFIWIPLVINSTIENNIEECYGISKTSGGIFDAVRFARPLIIPDHLNIDKYQVLSAFKYRNTDELLQFINDMIFKPDKYQFWQEKALEVSRWYTINNLRAVFSSDFSFKKL